MIHKVFVINRAARIERKNHIIKQFKNKNEFDVVIFNAIEHEVGSYGLFKSFQTLVSDANSKEMDYIIVCEDDHVFTENYNFENLNLYINWGIENDFDILLGGPSNVQDVVFANDEIYWTNKFSGLQFTIVFKRFYQVIMNFELEKGRNFDLELGNLSDNIYGVYPSISKQLCFGYSDVTTKNNYTNVDDYYKRCNEKLDHFYIVNNYYIALTSNFR